MCVCVCVCESITQDLSQTQLNLENTNSTALKKTLARFFQVISMVLN